MPYEPPNPHDPYPGPPEEPKIPCSTEAVPAQPDPEQTAEGIEGNAAQE